MQLSLAPILLAIELGFLLALVRHGGRTAPVGGPAHAYWLWLVAYGVTASALGAHGVYIAEGLLRWLPALWLQVVTVAACVMPVLWSERVRADLRQIADATPWHWFAYFHALRIAALGTVYKTWIGEFPAYFELLVGVPDLLFGMSAVWVGRKAQRGEISRREFFYWNLLGALVIVPAAPILLQLGLPGPMQIFESLPDARAVFTYPMCIASMVGVPLFVLVNLGVAWRLWEQRSQRSRE